LTQQPPKSSSGTRQADAETSALDRIERGVSRMLSDFENPEADLLSGEAAKAVVFWVLTHEGVHEALREARKLGSMDHTVLPDLSDVAYRVLGLPRD
jgi:hypothetical protein